MLASTYLLGIDLGTSSTKAVLVTPTGEILGQASREYGIQSLQPGWAEQNPDTWMQAVLATIRQVVQQANVHPRQIASVGLSGQMHGLVCTGKFHQALRPAIIWADQRSAHQVKEVVDTLGTERISKWTGNPLATGFMLASWLWLREHEAETTRKTAWLLLPKDYVRLQLTGEVGSEPSDAASTLLFDTVHRQWSYPLLDALQIARDLLPPVYEPEAIAGGLSHSMAQACGLLPGTPVVFGASDQAAQALGHGVVHPGTVACTIGTGGQLFSPVHKPVIDSLHRLHLFCHAVPHTWHHQAATLSAGLALRWLRDRVLPEISYQALADLALEAPPGCEGLLFLPHLLGERTPYMDPQSRAAFTGLTLAHGREHLVRAVMEGVVLSLRLGLELMESLGPRAGRIVASGGGTRHPLWLQLQADIFNRPIYQTHSQEAAAFGAALLAGVGSGVYTDIFEACSQAVRWHEEVISPIPENVSLYETVYTSFQNLYGKLKDR